MNRGTTWTDRALALWSAIKAPPTPGQLYAPQRPSGAAGPLGWEGWPDLGGTGRGLSPLGHTNRQGQQDLKNAKLAVQSVWVYSCCQAIAGEISAARLVVKRRVEKEGEEDVENHPWEKLWEQPNPFFGRASLMAYWAWSLLLTGEAYLFMRPVGGTLAEIWPVPPWSIEPIPDQKAFISGYRYDLGDDKAPLTIEAKYICYSRLTNVFDPRRGLSPLVAALVAVESDLAMRAWNKNFFSKENAAPSGMITVPRDTLDADLEVIRQQIWDYFGSGQRRVGVARAGDLAWTAFDRSQKDMEFLQGREFARTEISRAFGIPDGYWDKDATRANSEGAKATMIEQAVWPKLVLLMEDLNAQAAPHWIGEDDLRITFDDIRPRNIAAEMQEFTTHATVLTVNELRRLTNRDPLPDYRGLMLLEEVKKGAPLPATIPAMAAEDAAAEMGGPGGEEMEGEAMEADEGSMAGEPEAEETTLEEQPDAEAEELKRWERKALKALRAGRGAAVRFVSEAIPAEEAARISAALGAATTPDAVKAAFLKAEAEPDIDGTWETAVKWARLALEEGE
jgi:HK97 family phage portal protein